MFRAANSQIFAEKRKISKKATKWARKGTEFFCVFSCIFRGFILVAAMPLHEIRGAFDYKILSSHLGPSSACFREDPCPSASGQ